MPKQNENSTPPTRRTLTVAEVADIAGVSRISIYEAVRRGEIQAVRIGKRIVVPRTVVDQLFPQQAA
jgi:excisionase family DNA binding protein